MLRSLRARRPRAAAIILGSGALAAGAALTGFVTCALGQVAAADVFVSPQGLDERPCTAREPCGSLARAYEVAAPGDTIEVAAATYPAQEVPAGSKRVVFRGRPGATLRELDNHADNVTFAGIDVDAAFAPTAAFENHGADNVTFKDGRIGNVMDRMGALVSGAGFTFDDVVFHDVRFVDPAVHTECLYAIGVPGMTIRNSTFHGCATMDVLFTYGDWWTPAPPAYGGVTLENNVFGHSTMQAPDSWHYYSVYIGSVGPGGGTLDGWTVRNNTFETPVVVTQRRAAGSRWVGNLGTWDCVAGVRYRYNVGRRCASRDRAVRPAASTRDRRAPFGWVNPAANDFHLAPWSPAINAGDPHDHPPTDRDGKVRPSGRGVDAGAYEHV